MSVLLSDLMLASDRGPSDAIANLERFALAAITAGLARQLDQTVAHEPDEDEPAHAVVIGKKTSKVRKRFAKEAEWVIPPPLHENVNEDEIDKTH